MIKVVVVDDSAFMRKAISTMLEKDPGIEVVATARNGEEGLDLIREHQPDVVTLDIEMPRMDGLTALRHIMMEMPRPVLMVSSLTTEGAEATLKALELGAVDFIPKQLSRVSLDIVKIEQDLINKVKTVAQRKMRHHAPRPVTAPAPRPAKMAMPGGTQVRDVVAIGVSTGGPPAVQKVLSALPGDFPASIVIAQRVATVLNADKILVLDQGRIADEGTHDELLRNSELYAEIYCSQLQDDRQPEMAQVPVEEVIR